MYIHGCVYSSPTEARKTEQIVQRCGGTVEPFFSREISCILCLRDHLSSPEPAKCKNHCTHKTCTGGLGLKQMMIPTLRRLMLLYHLELNLLTF